MSSCGPHSAGMQEEIILTGHCCLVRIRLLSLRLSFKLPAHRMSGWRQVHLLQAADSPSIRTPATSSLIATFTWNPRTNPLTRAPRLECPVPRSLEQAAQVTAPRLICRMLARPVSLTGRTMRGTGIIARILSPMARVRAICTFALSRTRGPSAIHLSPILIR